MNQTTTSMKLFQTIASNTTQSNKNIESEEKKDSIGISLGLGFGLTANAILLLIGIIYIFIGFSSLNSISKFGYSEFIKTILWCFIASIIFIVIGYFEFIKSNNYKNLWRYVFPNKNGIGKGKWEKYDFDQALKYFSYINFIIGGLLCIYILICMVILFSDKEKLVKKDLEFNNLIKSLKTHLKNSGYNPYQIREEVNMYSIYNINKLKSYIKSFNPSSVELNPPNDGGYVDVSA